jgi:hypothetical protein
VESRDGVGGVLIERTDLREVVGIREEHAAQRAEKGRHDEESGDTRVTSETDHDGH